MYKEAVAFEGYIKNVCNQHLAFVAINIDTYDISSISVEEIEDLVNAVEVYDISEDNEYFESVEYLYTVLITNLNSRYGK